MSLSIDDLSYLGDCANEAARSAGRLIAESRPRAVNTKAGGHSPASQIVTEVDHAAQERILEILTPTLGQFDLGVLAEERHDDGSRFEKNYFWSIDPLDGTLPYVEEMPGYAVSIALVSRAGRPIIGTVYDPTESQLYSAIQGLGVFRNGDPWRIVTACPGARLSVFADRSLTAREDFKSITASLGRLASTLGLDGADIQIGAGAVMNACNALMAPAGCYFKFPKNERGGGSLWDFAATACLFTEAGAIATDIVGAPLDLNRPDSTFMNHRGALYASNQEIADRIRDLWPA